MMEGSLPAAVTTVATGSQSLPHTDSLLTAAYKYTRMNVIKTTNTHTTAEYKYIQIHALLNTI